MKKNSLTFLILLSFLLSFILLVKCDTETSPEDGSGNPGVLPPFTGNPAQAILGEWECPIEDIDSSADEIKLNFTFSNDGTYEKIKSYIYTDYGHYVINTGTYELEDSTINYSELQEGQSYTTLEDAWDDLATIETNLISQDFYVDNTYFCDNEVYIRQDVGTSILGTWENKEGRDEYLLFTNTLTITEDNYTYFGTVLNTNTSQTYDDNYTLDCSFPEDGKITIIIQLDEETSIPITMDYYLANERNTLVLNPCTRVE